MAKLWFATLLRDGFALTAAGDNGMFGDIGAEVLRGLLSGIDLNRGLGQAVAPDHTVAALTELPAVLAGRSA